MRDLSDYTSNPSNPHTGLDGCFFTLALVGLLTFSTALVLTRALIKLVVFMKGLG